jgi:hypothetical protein
MALSLDRPDLGEPCRLRGDVEEAADPAGRRCVENHRVVHPASVDRPRHGLLHLAGEQHVTHPRRDRRGEIDGAEALQRSPRPAQLVEHVQVIQERPLRIDGQTEHLSAAAGGRTGITRCDLAVLVRQRSAVENLGDALALLHLYEQCASPFPGQGEREGGGDCGLARASLAGHHVQARGPPRGLVGRRHSNEVTHRLG